MTTIPLTLADALAAYRRGDALGAERGCEHLLERNAHDAQALLALAEIRLAAGRPAAAIAPLRTLTDLLPNAAAHHRRLGGALLAVARPRDAVEVLRRALELEPDDLRGLNNLGQALLVCGAIDEAVLRFERAIALDPSYAIAHNNLGLALDRLGRCDSSLAALRRAICIDPGMLSARINLANLLERAGRAREALTAYEAALQLEPTNFEALVGRGTTSAELGDFEAARSSLELAVAQRPGEAPTLARLAGVLLLLERVDAALLYAERALQAEPDLAEGLHYKAAALCRLDRLAEALAYCARALAARPDFIEAWCTRARVHEHRAEAAEAAGCYRRALQIDPECVQARTGLLSAQIPAIASTTAEAAAARIAFDAQLASLEAWVRGRKITANAALALASQPLFYLSYDEASNREFLSRYRRLGVQALTHAGITAYGDDTGEPAATVSGTTARSPAARRPGRPRVRLGIVSAHVHDHSVFNAITRSWLAGLPRAEFEITVFSLGAKRDACTRAAAAMVEHFVEGSRGAAAWLQSIGGRRLDAIIFPEVGMDRTTLALAAHRLAPRQFAAWGHPETTGLPTIDVYLSAELFEPPDADRHYCETLLRMPGIGVDYESSGGNPSPLDLAARGIRDRAVKFVCPGTPFKYRPQYDRVFIDIASRVDDCVFVFFTHEKSALSGALRSRLAAAFGAAGLDAKRHLIWLPWLPRAQFAGLMRQCDVYLDTIGFSGFNTMVQALEAGIPVVTYEGRFMRGRFGSGLLRGTGLATGIATSLTDYVDKAVRWAEHATLRQEFAQNAPRLVRALCRNGAATAALARALREA